MSRRDYVAIAGKLAWALAYADGASTEGERAAAHAAVAVAIHGIADVFAADNARFDRSRFVAAAAAVRS
ncbi:hypothetical protein BH24ACT5_BH24ACT5_00240 [soil metagenome]